MLMHHEGRVEISHLLFLVKTRLLGFLRRFGCGGSVDSGGWDWRRALVGLCVLDGDFGVEKDGDRVLVYGEVFVQGVVFGQGLLGLAVIWAGERLDHLGPRRIINL
jgi:hypothetical protein